MVPQGVIESPVTQELPLPQLELAHPCWDVQEPGSSMAASAPLNKVP